MPLRPRSLLLLLPIALFSPNLLAAHHLHESKRSKSPQPEPDSTNPLLPPQFSIESLLPDMSLVQKTPATYPAGIAPLYSTEEWRNYRTSFGEEADTLGRKKSSELLAFSEKLIAAADEPDATPGLRNLLLLRAATDCYRTRGGYVVANKAVTDFVRTMDTHSPAQMAALWTIANAMSCAASTPRPDRIHYSAIAARANMQLTLLLLNADQLAPAESLMKMIGYHEGWVHTSSVTAADKPVYSQIAKVRAMVKQTAATMNFLASQYQPAINGDDNALMAIYLYGRYVKGKPSLVADLPARKPSSPMAQLAAELDAVDRAGNGNGDPDAPYNAAVTLRTVAENLPDGTGGGSAAVLKQRTLYAALQLYRQFIADPRTEKERVKRTLARMAIESVISDGARGPKPIVNPFAPPPPPPTPAAMMNTTQDAASPSPPHPSAPTTTLPYPTPLPALASTRPVAAATAATRPEARASERLPSSTSSTPAPSVPSMPVPTMGSTE